MCEFINLLYNDWDNVVHFHIDTIVFKSVSQYYCDEPLRNGDIKHRKCNFHYHNNNVGNANYHANTNDNDVVYHNINFNNIYNNHNLSSEYLLWRS
jgi:ABC-type enterochelin transport system ATPase subunit